MSASPLHDPEWIDPAAAAARLGVKPAALRAYAARGLLVLREEDGAVGASGLARLSRGRAPVTAAPTAPVEAAPAAPIAAPLEIETALTETAPGVVRHRGRDAVEIAQRFTLEETARLLWGAEEDPFTGLAPRPVAMLGADPRARALAFLAGRAAIDPPSAGRTEAVLIREAGALLSDLVDALCGASRGGPLHERLAKTWRLDASGAEAVRQALVLCADEVMDAATVSVRAVAATGASLAASLLPGVGALCGPAETGETLQAGLFILEARRIGDAKTAVSQRLGLNLPLPGFAQGDPPGDPRARALALACPWGEDIRDLARVGEALAGRPYTMDFALAALGRTLGLPGDAGLAIKLLGRCTGWLGHALEQKRDSTPMRFKARYVGVTAEQPVVAAPPPVEAEAEAGNDDHADAA